MKPSEQAQVNFIADCLRKGEQRGVILAKFGKKWQGTSTRTFDRRLRQAETHVAGEQARIKGQAEQEVAKEADALKSKILTSFERKVYLTSIIKGEVRTKQPFVVGGKIMEYPAEPSLTDKLKALAELNKMDGSYSPIKTELDNIVSIKVVRE